MTMARDKEWQALGESLSGYGCGLLNSLSNLMEAVGVRRPACGARMVAAGVALFGLGVYMTIFNDTVGDADYRFYQGGSGG